MALDPTIIAGGLKLLAGLGGKKQRFVPPSEMIASTAEGARDAGAKFGFNPLTLLGLGAQSGMTPGSPPPLASLAVLGDMIEDKYGEDAKTRREYNRLQNELLTLEVQRARTLNAVAPAQSVAGGGALTGGRGNVRVSGPATGFLTETDRNPPMADERDNTVSFQSHGQETVVPVGPDSDEVLMGFFIDANNRRKARLDPVTGYDRGTPLGVYDDIMPPIRTRNYGDPNVKARRFPPAVNNRVSYEIYSALRRRAQKPKQN